MNCLRFLSKIVSMALLLGAAGHGHAQDYSLTLLPGAWGNTNSAFRAINNAGQIIGSSSTRNIYGFDTQVATTWRWSYPSSLPGLGGTPSYFSGINDAGLIVGSSYAAGNQVLHAVAWGANGPVVLQGLGGFDSANGVNNAGQIVGTIGGNVPGLSTSHAVIWHGSTMTQLADAGRDNSGLAINDSGQVVGSATGNSINGTSAVLWDGGLPTVLKGLGGFTSFATSINNAGITVGVSTPMGAAGNADFIAVKWVSSGLDPIVLENLSSSGGSMADAINESGVVAGYSTFTDGWQHATIWQGTQVFDLNNFLPLDAIANGWKLTEATSLNDAGIIVGNARNTILGVSAGFILTPVPEPATMGLLTLGLIALTLHGRKSFRRRIQ